MNLLSFNFWVEYQTVGETWNTMIVSPVKFWIPLHKKEGSNIWRLTTSSGEAPVPELWEVWNAIFIIITLEC